MFVGPEVAGGSLRRLRPVVRPRLEVVSEDHRGVLRDSLVVVVLRREPLGGRALRREGPRRAGQDQRRPAKRDGGARQVDLPKLIGIVCRASRVAGVDQADRVRRPGWPHVVHFAWPDQCPITQPSRSHSLGPSRILHPQARATHVLRSFGIDPCTLAVRSCYYSGRKSVCIGQADAHRVTAARVAASVPLAAVLDKRDACRYTAECKLICGQSSK